MADQPGAVAPYDQIGGEPAVRRLTHRFYQIMDESPGAGAVRAMHGPDLAAVEGRLFAFLCAWLGGPRHYFDRENAPCVMGLHRQLPIGAAERDQWLACMNQALGEIEMADDLRARLMAAFSRMAEAMRTR